jgi:hypothetical protein
MGPGINLFPPKSGSELKKLGLSLGGTIRRVMKGIKSHGLINYITFMNKEHNPDFHKLRDGKISSAAAKVGFKQESPQLNDQEVRELQEIRSQLVLAEANKASEKEVKLLTAKLRSKTRLFRDHLLDFSGYYDDFLAPKIQSKQEQLQKFAKSQNYDELGESGK